MKVYIGYRRENCVTVTVESAGGKRSLPPRHDIANHSPDGFEWGYGGSGPAQLALALVANCCGDKAATPAVYQAVKWDIVAKLPHDGWTLTDKQIIEAVEAAENEVRK